MSARKAMMRWSWRLFLREWRQQVLVLALLAVAVAGTIVGLGVVTNATTSLDPTFGNAATMATLPGNDPNLAADIAQVQAAVGHNEVIEDQAFTVPGSVLAGDLRAEDPNGAFGHQLLGLVSGHYPTGASEVAVTSGIASDFNLHTGSVWVVGGRARTVVGTVENPLELHDQFALVPPGQVTKPALIKILSDAGPSALQNIDISQLNVESRGSERGASRALAMLLVSTVALLFVGLLAAAGFTVMAQRRQRSLGMVSAIGATDKQVRLVMIANGAAVGAVAAVVGMGAGLGVWLAFAPRLANITAHRVSRFNLPWWAIGAAMVLAFVTAIAAAWWPAHAAAQVPIVAALSGRPPRPVPAHRSAIRGLVFLGIGLLALANRLRATTMLTIVGILATTIGVLFLTPIAMSALARLGGRSRIATRIALRDLARYQSRSGAAAAAISLAIGVAASIAIVAAAVSAGAISTPNLANNQLVVYLSNDGRDPLIPQETAAQMRAAQSSVSQMSTTLHAGSLELEEAIAPGQTPVPVRGGNSNGRFAAALVIPLAGPGGQTGEQLVAPLYVATPAVLAHYGITSVDPGATLLSSRTDLAGDMIDAGAPNANTRDLITPVVQKIVRLPQETSSPNVLITESAVRSLHLTLVPAGWLLTASHALTSAQVHAAQGIAAGVGLSIESRTSHTTLNQVRTDATIVGVLLALGVLAMTVGLIRSEAANDLRMLAATGAASTVRRTITGVTGGALALVGAVLGVAGAYLAMIAWNHNNLTSLGNVPLMNLAVILLGLPIAATAGSWLLAGREPAALGRRPLD